MQETDVIYKIANQIKDRENIKNDIKEVISLASDLFKKKYLYTLQEEIDTHIKVFKQNPTKEITLLQAIKPFVEKNSHQNIDKCIDTLTNLNVFSTIRNKVFHLDELKDNNIKNTIEISEPNTAQTASIKDSNLTYKTSDEDMNSLSLVDNSVKKDGVYDLDENCLLAINNNNREHPSIIFILAILLLFLVKN